MSKPVRATYSARSTTEEMDRALRVLRSVTFTDATAVFRASY